VPTEGLRLSEATPVRAHYTFASRGSRARIGRGGQVGRRADFRIVANASGPLLPIDALSRIERDVQSGKSLNGRPGLERAFRACRSGEAAGIVTAKLDRLPRFVIDFAKLLEEARKRGFNIVALDLGLDLSTPQGELVANVIASVAQWERRIIGQRTAEGLAAKRAQGVKLGRPRMLPESVRRRIKHARARDEHERDRRQAHRGRRRDRPRRQALIRLHRTKRSQSSLTAALLPPPYGPSSLPVVELRELPLITGSSTGSPARGLGGAAASPRGSWTQARLSPAREACA
jgi:DNA invertase Pin-like site-specific DNA recombinase